MRVEQAHRFKELEQQSRQDASSMPFTGQLDPQEAAGGTSKPVPETQDHDSCPRDACSLRDAGLPIPGASEIDPAPYSYLVRIAHLNEPVLRVVQLLGNARRIRPNRDGNALLTERR
jgi:hypothetical protein